MARAHYKASSARIFINGTEIKAMVVDKREIEEQHRFVFRRKEDLRLMRMVAWLLNLLPKLRRLKRVQVDPEPHREKSVELEVSYQVELVARGDRFMRDFVTTYRLPGQRRSIVAVPSDISVIDPRLKWLWEHEAVHVEQQRTFFGLLKSFFLLWLVPLPVVLSGRWYIKRHAFMVDLRAGIKTPEEAAELLWRDYLWAWPKRWAERWWRRELARGEPF